MLHPIVAFEIAHSRHGELLRQSEKEHRLRRLGFIPESPWRKRRMSLVRLLSLFF